MSSFLEIAEKDSSEIKLFRRNLKASSWLSIFWSNFLPLTIVSEPRIYLSCGGGAVRPSIWVSAICLGALLSSGTL